MSDNGMFNFGLRLRGNDVLIIDAGSRQVMADTMIKSDFNAKCMRNFFSKAPVYWRQNELEPCKAVWQKSGYESRAENF